MENYDTYIPQIEALISSGSRDSIELALEIAKSMGLYEKIVAPWKIVWEHVSSRDTKDISDVEMICKCTNERYIRFYDEKMKEIPSAIFLMQNLEYLTIEYAQLTELPIRLSELKNLESINFSNNQIRKVPAEILQMSSLISVDLSKNLLKELPALGLNVQYLCIADNKFQKTPQALLNKNGITALNISNNPGFVWDLLKFDINKIYFFSADNCKYVIEDFSKNSRLSNWFNEKYELKWVFGSDNSDIQSRVYYSPEVREYSFCIYDDFDDSIFYSLRFDCPVEYEEDELGDFLEDFSFKNKGSFKYKFPLGQQNACF
jgi:hypothetical protein